MSMNLAEVLMVAGLIFFALALIIVISIKRLR